jgi:hypothetical protein
VINTRNVENIVQRQLVELNDVDKEEPAKEYMGRNGNASEEESGECYCLRVTGIATAPESSFL